jgi:hypothetical protein
MPGTELFVPSKRILQRQLENLVVPSKANVTFLMDHDDGKENDLHYHETALSSMGTRRCFNRSRV